jgi:hypothetical protein
MTTCWLFYHPKDRKINGKISKMMDAKRIRCTLIDATHSSTSSYLYKDMRITRLPAYYVLSQTRSKEGCKVHVYEGRKNIEAALTRK